VERLRNSQQRWPETAAAQPPLPAAAPMAEISFDPVHVLGCSPEKARRLFHGRPVTPGEAEAIAERSYQWRSHLHDPESYWVTTSQAAQILGIPSRQVRRLLDHHRLPFVRHASGARLMRRHQIEALASKRSRPVLPGRVSSTSADSR
jgi:excisionase family DNA binding protein